MANLEYHLEGSLKGTLERNFLYISFIFYSFISIYFTFYSFIKVNYRGYIQVVLFLKVPLVYNYSTYYIKEFPIFFFCIL